VIAAGSTLIVASAFLFSLLANRLIVSGMTAGAVKG
jgi:ABC-type glycerol-3-phosphate transport system permease component